MPTLPTLGYIYKLSNSWRRKMKKKYFYLFSESQPFPQSPLLDVRQPMRGEGNSKEAPLSPYLSAFVFVAYLRTFGWKYGFIDWQFAWCLIDMSFKRSSYSGTPKIRKANTVWLIGCQESNKVKVAQGKVGWNRGWWWPTNVTTKETSIWLFRMQVSFLDVAMFRLERVEKRWTGMADVAIFGCQPCWAARDKEKLSQLNLWTNTNKNTEIIFIFCATVAFKGEQL